MFKHYLITALRSFRRQRLSTVISILGLAIGLTCFVATNSATGYLQSGDQHFKNAPRTYAISERITSIGSDKFDTGTGARTSPLLAKYLRIDFPQLEAVAHAGPLGSVPVSTGLNKAFVSGAYADAAFLNIFDFPFEFGGGASALSEPRSVVITREAAQRLFGTTDAVGKRLLLRNAIEMTVTGVTGPLRQPSQFGNSPINSLRFDVLFSSDVLDEILRLNTGRRYADIPEIALWGAISVFTYVLLPNDGSLSLDQLNAGLEGFATRHVPAERRRLNDYEFRALSLSKVWTSSIDTTLLRGTGISIVVLLHLLGGLVLLTACANYANLAAALGTARGREVGLRKVVGASSVGVAIQHIVETTLLVALSLVIALATVLLLAAPVQAVSGIDIAQPLQQSLKLWIFLAMLLIAVSIGSGLYPAWITSRLRPAQALRGGKIRASSPLIAKLLVGGQFATTSALLITVIVIYAQNNELRHTALGSAPDQVVVLDNDLQSSRVSFKTLEGQLLDAPQINAVAIINNELWGFASSTWALRRESGSDSNKVEPFWHTVAGDFIAVFDLTLLAGRTFDEKRGSDALPDSFPQAVAKFDPNRTYDVIVDRSFAKQMGWEEPRAAVDQLVYLPQFDKPDQRMRIIGVVSDKPLRLTTSGATSNVFTFLPEGTGFPIVRVSTGGVGEALEAIDDVWNRLAPNIPLKRRFMDEMFDQSYATFTRISQAIAGLAVLALIVAVMGLFGMAFFVASHRTREIGLRKTVGASTVQVVLLLLKDFSKPVVIANLVAWPFAYLAAQSYLGAFVHQIALTPWPFVLGFLITLSVAWIAVGGQTIRAARLKPATVLRYE